MVVIMFVISALAQVDSALLVSAASCRAAADYVVGCVRLCVGLCAIS